MKNRFRAALKILWKVYKYGSCALGTLVICYLAFAFITLGVLGEKKYSFVVPLRSGFIYYYDMQDGKFNGHYLSDKSGNLVIFSDVKNFAESGNVIYGYREDLHDNPFYFICEYGKDCADTQHLTDVELRRIIQKRGLPLYTANGGVSRRDLIREIERFYEKAGRETEPRWEYEKVTGKYRAFK